MALEPGADPAEALGASQRSVIAGTAETGLKSLGWSFASLPKQGPVGRVVVNAVTPGGWAEELGVQTGDRLALINGEPPDRMEPKRLFAAMKSRPLELTFHRYKRPAWQPPSPTHPNDDRQGPRAQRPLAAAGAARGPATSSSGQGAQQQQQPRRSAASGEETRQSGPRSLPSAAGVREGEAARFVVIRGSLTVFESPESLERCDLLKRGEIVYAAGPAQQVKGYRMQPIAPKGAVESKFLRPVVEAEELDLGQWYNDVERETQEILENEERRKGADGRYHRRCSFVGDWRHAEKINTSGWPTWKLEDCFEQALDRIVTGAFVPEDILASSGLSLAFFKGSLGFRGIRDKKATERIIAQKLSRSSIIDLLSQCIVDRAIDLYRLDAAAGESLNEKFAFEANLEFDYGGCRL